MEGIRQYDSLLLPYAPSQGLPETVAAWQAYYAQLGLELASNQLLVTTGGSEALLFAMMAVADPGDEILVFEPTYANYFGFAVMTSIGMAPVTLRGEDGYHLPPAAEIERRITLAPGRYSSRLPAIPPARSSPTMNWRCWQISPRGMASS
jgi:aspartate aminotransferase